MKVLRDILYKTGILEVTGSTDKLVGGICFDSRMIRQDDVFVAIRGLHTDGHNHIEQAVAAGACSVLCETMPAQTLPEVTYIRVQDTAEALGYAASNFYDNPSHRMQVIGVTGTNGKTSVVTLLHNLFLDMGYACGLLSTVRNLINDKALDAQYTTPDPVQLNALLKDMVDAGCSFVFMEVSSHAMSQKRTSGIRFAGGVFTNITHDHLDYHKTFAAYLSAKKSFFDAFGKEAFALTNLDDKNGLVMLQNTRARKVTYGLQHAADYMAKIIESDLSGMHLMIDSTDMWCRLVGRFNAYNLLAVYAVARLMGLDRDEALTKLSQSIPPEGRFDHFTASNQVTAIVDYAHTPDALENVLNTINQVRQGAGQLITVMGCGGNRDAAKRPIMAAIGAAQSEKLILTSDNPRMEDPAKIIEEMKAGLDIIAMRKTLCITDRREAIKTACALAQAGDIVLVAGKGHEKYQEIQGIKYPFDDKQILMDILS